MRPEPTCPRCAGALQPPGLWSSHWRCADHGLVLPFTAYPRNGPEVLDHVRARTAVPLWAPVPAPPAWAISGFGHAGDERSSARATVVACSGPAPLGGAADLLLIAEDPGVGLGARYAGLPGPDPGSGFDVGAPDAKVEVLGHPTALWSVDGAPDRAVFVGEAKALWLWVIVSPSTAGVLLYENLLLRDLRDRDWDAELAFGSTSPLLAGRPAAR